AVVQAAARMENARIRMARLQAARQATSPEDLQEKTTDHRVAQAEYDNQILIAKAGLATIEVKLEAMAIARQQLMDTQIRAPIPTQPIPGATGSATYTITSRAVAEGTFSRSGTEVFKLVIDRPLKLRALVPERHAAEIKLDQKAEVYTEAYSRPFAGTVTRINPAVDPA